MITIGSIQNSELRESSGPAMPQISVSCKWMTLMIQNTKFAELEPCSMI